MKAIAILAILLFLQALNSMAQNESQRPVCRTWNDIENSENKEATVIGRLQHYTPSEKGKGAGYMFWDWEIQLADSTSIPIKAGFPDATLNLLNNKTVMAAGLVFFGIVIGSDAPDEQHAIGYRLDLENISEFIEEKK